MWTYWTYCVTCGAGRKSLLFIVSAGLDVSWMSLICCSTLTKQPQPLKSLDGLNCHVRHVSHDGCHWLIPLRTWLNFHIGWAQTKKFMNHYSMVIFRFHPSSFWFTTKIPLKLITFSQSKPPNPQPHSSLASKCPRSITDWATCDPWMTSWSAADVRVFILTEIIVGVFRLKVIHMNT